MNAIWEGRIAGVFEGYQGGRVYELSDGSCWKQESRTEEYVYREDPRARLLRDGNGGQMYLDVEGTSNVVRVLPDGGISGISAAAF